MNNKQKNILLGVLIVGVISMTIAFAAYSTRLNINGTAKASSFNWQIVIDDWERDTNVSSLVSGSTNTAEQITAGSPANDTTSVSGLSVAFHKPGDVVKYNFNIENKGNIDAELDSWHLNTGNEITCTSNNNAVECPSITFEVKCGDTDPAVGDALNAGGSIACTYKVGYNEVNGTNGYTSDAITISGLGVRFTYKEKAGSNPAPIVQQEPICKRATTLHTPTCTQSGTKGCATSGDVGNGNQIEYGVIGTGSTLTAGEALDCKVSTSGDYTERFYYITDLESNSDYAVLLYSQDTGNTLPAYDSSGENWHGPQTAVSSLPTTSTWDNISLASTSRQLYAWDKSNPYVYNTTKTNKGSNTLGTFSYNGYAGRLLTVKELRSACPNASYSTGSLSSCSYLMENTKYDNSSNTNYGYWLETPHASNSNRAWLVHGSSRTLGDNLVDYSGTCGARPAIEVLKSKISLD